ncbi:chorismate mutase [Candidatus Woesearchaeota archaeon]|nr:chorismate mutase [Candidatus Woesearchaeota archaeon]
MLSLKSNREIIDSIDNKMISLLSERIRIAEEISGIKKEKGLKIADKAREKQVMNNAVTQAAENGLDEGFIREIFSKIIDYTKSKQALK